jgi:hypothetical protein
LKGYAAQRSTYPKVIGQNLRRTGDFTFRKAIGWYVEGVFQGADCHEFDELPHHAATFVFFGGNGALAR